MLAHRLAWFFYFGEHPKGEVMHSCDFGLCVRPSHLSDGTHSDNMRGAIARGRMATPKLSGEQHPMAKLADSQVEEIRRRRKGGELLSSIAAHYGVRESCISRIANGARRALMAAAPPESEMHDGDPQPCDPGGVGQAAS